uniref:Uncharacterized protein n=1 Tax=Anguilla anguilla TaxID=7936 RepID=A0A0E9TLR6_ANGAN
MQEKSYSKAEMIQLSSLPIHLILV